MQTLLDPYELSSRTTPGAPPVMPPPSVIPAPPAPATQTLSDRPAPTPVVQTASDRPAPAPSAARTPVTAVPRATDSSGRLRTWCSED
ncbi:MAG TPA: hypothetical protein VGG39_16390 [Polyangiaceae bacterium]|jgi:hypothetical protein